MRIGCVIALLIGVQLSTPAERLIAARTRAYDANFQNDAAGLRAASAEFEKLTSDATIGKRALYDASWTEWALAMSEMQRAACLRPSPPPNVRSRIRGKPSSRTAAIRKCSRCW